MPMFRMFSLCLCLSLLVSSHIQNVIANQEPSAAEIPKQRVLPLRGAALLEQLTRPVAILRDVNVSPDGTKIFYVETTLRNRESVAGSEKLWLQDVTNGQRFLLAGYEPNIRALVLGKSDLRLFRPQWSNDSKQVAFLESHDDLLSLLIWNTDQRSAESCQVNAVQCPGDTGP